MEPENIDSQGSEKEQKTPDQGESRGGNSAKATEPRDDDLRGLVPRNRDQATFVQEAEVEYRRLVSEFGNRLSKEATERSKAEENTFVDYKHVRSAYSYLVTDRPKKSLFRDISSILGGVSIAFFSKLSTICQN